MALFQVYVSLSGPYLYQCLTDFRIDLRLDADFYDSIPIIVHLFLMK